MPKKQFAIGIDLGGTNARAALVDSDGTVLNLTQTSAKSVQKPDQFADWVAQSKKILTTDSARLCAGVGVGFPGSVDVDNGIVHSLTNLPGWKNLSISKMLKQRLKTEVQIDNDANVMALAEFRMGAAKGVQNAVFLTLGTGVGGGLLINGRLFHGTEFSASEIGHMRAGFSETVCACGKRGCIETEVGNRYLINRFRKDLKAGKVRSRIIKQYVREAGENGVTLEMITGAAQKGDAYAVNFWHESGERLGDFLSGICNLLNPEAIVLGGGVMGAGKFLLNPIRATIKRQAFAKASSNLKVLKAKFGNKAGLVGAAALTMRNV